MKKNKEQPHNRLVVGSMAWADTIPQWILDEVASERTLIAALNCTGKKLQGWEQVGDAEVVAYLMPATMAHPVDSDYVTIYLYLSSKLMIQTKRASKETLPSELKQALTKGLTTYQESLLRNLKSKIGRARGNVHHPVFDALLEVFKHSNREKGGGK